ncbi:Acetylornithine aminotransferase [Trichinella spiralis]|uniref:Acetylornithine aminotransferase n=1 Tax=Trichinella spiralis TaxID=6334 RepID=A0ABR3KNH7_TRISP
METFNKYKPAEMRSADASRRPSSESTLNVSSPRWTQLTNDSAGKFTHVGPKFAVEIFDRWSMLALVD